MLIFFKIMIGILLAINTGLFVMMQINNFELLKKEWFKSERSERAVKITNKVFPICYLLFNIICFILLIFA
jgi:hypothetical protein